MTAWNTFQQIAHEIALGVDDGDATSRFDVAEREIQQQRALADTGRPVYVEVVERIGGRNPDLRVPPVLESADEVPFGAWSSRGRKPCRRRSKTGNVDR